MIRRDFLGALLAPLLGFASLPKPKPRLVVVDIVGAALEFFDLATFARVGKVGLGQRPHEVAVAADGSELYVSIYGPGIYGDNPTPGHEIAVINAKTMQLSRRINTTPHAAPHGLAAGPDGRLWATCETEGSLLRIDPASKTSKGIDAVPLGVKGPHWVVLSPDGRKLYTSNKDNPVLSVIDVETGGLIAEIKTPGGVEGIAIAPDGRRLFAASKSHPVIRAIDTGADRVARELTLGEIPGRLHVVADGKSLLVTHYDSGTVEVFEIPSLRRRGVVRVGKMPFGMTSTGDGSLAFVSNWGDGTVTAFEPQSLRTIRTMNVGKGPDGLAILS